MFKKLLIFSSLLLLGLFSFAQDFPAKSNTLVTDYTNTLSAEEKQRLEDKLVAFDDSTGIQIAVVMMRSIGDYDVNEYATELGRRWGVGYKDKNTGIVILVAKDDRKLSIQTGYGMEGQLPDVITQQIRVNEINPRFKADDFYGGLDAGTDAIIKYNKGEYKADAREVKRSEKRDGGGSIGFVVIIVVFILIMIFRRGGGGGGGQVIGRRGSASPFWWMLAGSLMNSGNRGGGGSGWGGGGSSGGGGGFGGFGGGSFGGGGSGGSW
ncbi:TPM domain-containing protein [Mucilaginibacter auburnensis]|nr:TPM domain-containing protein [Mucilaginibacter auburnensis]